ncbi:MAG: gliding motility-associated C-terminal domain-containing protein [Saprospiraceae bacterium]|nr:gliding motility-associated C-terminal domain-containing protein [Saprospiraceae bacterium]
MKKNLIPCITLLVIFFSQLIALEITAQCPYIEVTTNEPPNYTYCLGDMISITATPSGGTPPYTYQWSTGGTGQTETVPAENTQYVVSVTDDNGCTGLGVAHLKPIVTSVNAFISQHACEGGTVVVTAFAHPDDIYAWSNGGNTPNISVTTPGIYSITVTNPVAGCTATDDVNVTFFAVNQPTIVGPSAMCAGQNAELSVEGGPFYNFEWAPSGETTSTINVSSPGTYSVTASNATNCTASATIEISPIIIGPPILSGTPFICQGGVGNIQVTNSSDFAFFQWSNGDDTPSIDVNNTGSYTVTVSNGAGCTATATYSIGLDPSSPLANTAALPETCGQGNGSINLTVSPSNGNSFAWSNGETTEDLSDLPSGTYNVTVTGSTGCTTNANAVVSDTPIPIHLSGTTMPNTACTAANGSIDLVVTPQGNYNFSWSNGATTEDLQNLSPGPYTVSVTLGSNCFATEQFLVDNNTSPITLNANTTANTSCQTPNGAIDLSPVPFGNYTFSWSNGGNTEDLGSLPQGNYTVTVTDAVGCSTSGSYDVPQNTNLPNVQSDATPTSCGQNNGAINITVLPSGTYTFSWSNGATTEDLQDLAAATYTVTVTDVNSCSATSSATVTNTATAFSLAVSAAPNTSCTTANGSIDLTPSPAGNFTFSWSNGATTEDLQNLTAATYTVTVTDANGCTSTATASVINNTTSFSLTASPTPNTSCTSANGSIDLTPSPAGSFTFSWSNGATTEDLQNLTAATYTVTVTGANGCSATSSAAVANNATTFSLAASPAPNTSCTSANGSIDLTPTPTGNFTFSWSNGATTEDLQSVQAGTYTVTVTAAGNCTTTASATVADNSSAPLLTPNISATNCNQNNGAVSLQVLPITGNSFLWSNGSTTPTIQNLAAGNYTVTVTTANSCTATGAYVVPSESADLVISAVSSSNASCISPNGSIDLTVSSPLTFNTAWSNGATTIDLSSLAAGSYTVTVTDANGCSGTATYLVPGPVQPQVTISGPATACLGTSATLSATNGFTNYTWSNGGTGSSIPVSLSGTYAVTATNANGCTATASSDFQALPLPTPSISGPASICGGDAVFSVTGGNFPQIIWSTGSTTASITVSQAATYTVTVTNADGCTATQSQDLNVGTSLLPVIASNTSACDGTATLDAGAGYASYLWSDGSTTPSISVATNGMYTVTVSDGTGCTGNGSATVSIPAPPQVQIAGASSICQGNSTSFSVAGNLTLINWSTGATSPSITVIQAGTYGVTVSDTNGCTASDTQTLVVGQGLSPDILPMLQDCNGTFTLDAGSAYANYLWSNGSTASYITVSGSGNYAVTVSDANGCTGIATETVTAPNPPTVQILGANQLCETDETTLATPGNYAQYLWTTGEFSPQILITQGGTYGVTVSDANGCTASSTWTVTQLQNDLTQLQATACTVQDTGSFTVVVSNQFGCDSVVVTTVTLSPLLLTQLELSVCQGETAGFNGFEIPVDSTRIFMLVSEAGCDSLVQVHVSALPAVSFELSAEKTCHDTNDGAIQVTSLSGTGPYSYALDNQPFQTSPFFQDLSGGIHSVLVEDANGCGLAQSIVVLESLPLELLTVNDTLRCEAGEVTLHPLLLSGQPEEVEWTWPDGSHQPWLTVTNVGTYKVQIQNACESIERSIQVVPDADYHKTDFFYIPNSFSPNGDGINDLFQAFPGQNLEIVHFELRLFDRWGNALFTAFDPAEGWDGIFRETQMQSTVYVWYVKATVMACGNRLMDVFLKGDVTIVR